MSANWIFIASFCVYGFGARDHIKEGTKEVVGFTVLWSTRDTIICDTYLVCMSDLQHFFFFFAFFEKASM